MKKKIAIFLSITLLSLTACGSDDIRDLDDVPYSSDTDTSSSIDNSNTSDTSSDYEETDSAYDNSDNTESELSDFIDSLGTENTGSDRNGPIRVGIINVDPNESGYRLKNDADMKRVFNTDNGYDASFAYSSRNDEQITAAGKFVQDKMDYLLIAAASPDGWDSVLRQAKDQGVNVILFDRTIDADRSLYITDVISDLKYEGEMAVNWLSDQHLSEYNIIHLQGAMGSIAQADRTSALNEQVNSSSNWNIVCQQTGQWNAETARQIVQSVISNGSNFNVIYAENDDMAKGAVEALDQSGISHGAYGDVKIISFDCSKWALQEVYNGSWNIDVQCSPFQADTIDKVIKDHEKGREADQYTILDEKVFDSSTITSEDIDNYGL